MASRVIIASVTSGSNANKAGGTYITFGSIYSDTGPVSNATPTSATLYISSYQSYSSTYYLNVIFGGSTGTIVASTGTLASNSSTHYSTEPLSGLSSYLTSSAVSTITLGVVSTSGTGNKINIRDACTITLTINYELNYTSCTAPTSIGISPPTVDAGSTSTLSWWGAGAGTNNPISGYAIYRSTSETSGYTHIQTVASTVTSASVSAPATMGSVYYFKVAAIGTADGAHALSSVYASLTAQTYTACTAPTVITVSSNYVAPGASITLAWSGAGSGTNNPVTGYQIYRATSATGAYSLLATVSSTVGSSSTTVTAPTTSSSSYYYKVLTVGTKSGYNSGMSAVYATLTCLFSAPSAPTTVTIGGGTSAYATAGASVTLAWSGATAGTNNPVITYDIYRDGALYVLGIPASTTSWSVVAHSTAGSSYSYTVVSSGNYSSSAASVVRVVYTYSSPSAPTTISVSNAMPDAGTDVTLSWSGASAGSYNAISSYYIYRSISATGTYSLLATSTTTSSTVTAPSSMGSSYYYKVQTIGARSSSALSILYATVTAKTYTACTAPATVSLSATTIAPGANVTLSWTAGGAGTSNPITGYAIYRRLGTGSYSLLSTVGSSALSVNVSAPGEPASSYTFYVITLGTKSGYDSTASGTVTLSSYTYTACKPPSTITLSSSIAEGNVTLSWSGASAGTYNAIAGFKISYQDSSDNTNWGTAALWTTISVMATSSSTSVSPPSTRGYYRRFIVQTLGAISGYDSAEATSGSLRKNRAPNPPAFMTGTVTYGTTPLVRLSPGTEPDGQSQTLYLSVDSGAAYACGTSSRLQSLSIGGHIVRAYSVDSMGAASPSIERSIEVLAPGYTDAALVAQQTLIRAAHINELRSHIDTERAYHGVGAYIWSDAPIPGTTTLALWMEHVLELRAAIDNLCETIGVAKPTWTALTVNCPRVAIMDELRQAAISI